MSKLTFQEDGPVKVSNTDFETYQELQPNSNVSSGYYIWIDENYSDGVRRLALRDVLHHDDRNALKHFEFSCGSIFMPKEPSIDETLRFRPKLLQELQEELYYCLEKSIRIYEPTKIRLIEFVLQLCSEDIIQKFWFHHPLRQKLEQGCVTGLLELCFPSHKMPGWLCQEIWSKITKHATNNLRHTDIFIFPPDHSYRSISCDYSDVTLKKLCDFFSDTAADDDTVVIAEQIAYWLEKNLPDDVVYNLFYIHSITEYAKRFRDIGLIYKVLRRHLMNLPAFQANGRPTVDEDIQFFFWCRGLIMQVAPDDKDLLHRIDDIIASNPQRGKIIYQ